VLLESFQPSARLTEPPYFCTYRGTDGLGRYDEYDSNKTDIGRLGEMYSMYSRFRPDKHVPVLGAKRLRLRPGDLPSSHTIPGAVQNLSKGQVVKQTLSLEPHELFTQVVAQTNLGKIGASHLFEKFVDIDEGVLRVWRDWLKETAARGTIIDTEAPNQLVGEVGKGKGKRVVMEVAEEKADLEDPRILWVSPRKDSGIRFNVREKKFLRNAPILISTDEDMPVTYKIEYDGESNTFLYQVSAADHEVELLIRTTRLLLMLEQSMLQEDNSSGKVVVFGSFG